MKLDLLASWELPDHADHREALAVKENWVIQVPRERMDVPVHLDPLGL